jgi:hypothetical protein
VRFLSKKLVILLLVGVGLTLFGAANAHLVYVAVTTQPECVAHFGSGEGKAAHGSFSAATSACSQRVKGLNRKQSE